MGYSLKVKFPLNNSLEVSGDDLNAVVALMNAVARKFFPTSYVSDLEIIP